MGGNRQGLCFVHSGRVVVPECWVGGSVFGSFVGYLFVFLLFVHKLVVCGGFWFVRVFGFVVVEFCFVCWWCCGVIFVVEEEDWVW